MEPYEAGCETRAQRTERSYKGMRDAIEASCSAVKWTHTSLWTCTVKRLVNYIWDVEDMVDELY